MIPRGQHASASLPKTRDALTICNRQTVAHIDREQPEFVELGLIEHTQYRIVTVSVDLTIAGRHVAEWLTAFVDE